MKSRIPITVIFAALLAGCASLVSTSTNPAERQTQLSPARCAGTYKHMLNFVKYWPPRSNYDWIMYNPKKVGFRGYDLLGDIYDHGCDEAKLAPDKVAAAYWYQAAAVAHVPEAQWKLGRMLIIGDGVPLNHDVGLAWITSAAIEGSAHAAAYLRDHDYPVPTPISPNSYAIAAERAHQRLHAAQVAQRQQAVQDLTGLLVNLGTVYVAAKVGSEAAQSTVHSPHVSSMPQLRMTKPVFCTTSGSANAMGSSVFFNVSRFCQ